MIKLEPGDDFTIIQQEILMMKVIIANPQSSSSSLSSITDINNNHPHHDFADHPHFSNSDLQGGTSYHYFPHHSQISAKDTGKQCFENAAFVLITQVMALLHLKANNMEFNPSATCFVLIALSTRL